MALTNCPECNNAISEKAKSCPHCGCPCTRSKKEIPFKCLFIVIGIFFVVVSVMLFWLIRTNDRVLNSEFSDSKNITVSEEEKDIIESTEILSDEDLYNNALNAVDNGEYALALEMLSKVTKKTNDMYALKELIEFETHIIACCEDFRSRLKNPDSLRLNDVEMYGDWLMYVDGEYEKKSSIVIILAITAQNGFGGNTASYVIYNYAVGSDEVVYLVEIGDFTDYENFSDEERKVVAYIEQLGIDPKTNFDIERVKTIVKDKAYVPIKVIN